MSRQRFQDRVMVITGAAQGIGRRVAEQAAAEGARLALVDRAEIVQELAAELTEQGVEAIALLADLEIFEGAVATTRMPCSAYSKASEAVMALTPPLAAEYGMR